MKVKKIFKGCPECGGKNIDFDNLKRYECLSCGWVYFQNPAAAAGCLFEKEGKILMIRRNKVPAKGFLDIPGGFVDPGEGAEEALKRELMEELSIVPPFLKYFGSFSNTYDYKGINYTTCDLFFTSTIEKIPEVFDSKEIAEVVWVDPLRITDEEFAFESLRSCIALYRKNWSK